MSASMLKELGANVLEDGSLGFLVWAPLRKSVELELIAPVQDIVQMETLDNGYFGAIIPDPGGEVQYYYILDDKFQRPDPASRYQPQGVHKPSALIRHDNFKWDDAGCSLPKLKDYITYELHVGTFTKEGTFQAVASKISYLKELGVTAVELMPVAQFPGARNWGYDGVHPYAVQNTYGGPEGLKELVNACHKEGLAVILDVVYNHLGPEGNYLGEFGPYSTDRYHGPWGDAMNFDGPQSEEVRRFFIENACYWFQHYHIDALRIDAIHGIFDSSEKHFLRELKETVASRITGRPVYLIAESDLNEVRVIEPPEIGGYGLDAQWNDDFHHALHTMLTGESDGYYMDFGRLEQMAKALREGFVYSGQYSEFRGKEHGTSTAQRPAGQLVVFSQNHDQIGNRMVGDRLSGSLSLEKLKLASAMVLLAPNLPLLFMGEEYGETAPFMYFVSHSDPGLVEAVRKGRREEFLKFKWKGDLPDPQSEDTFARSKINLSLSSEGDHRMLLEFYKTIIRLRKEHPALHSSGKEQMEVREFPEKRSLTIRRWDDENQFLLAVSFNNSAVTLVTGGDDDGWQKIFGSTGEVNEQKDGVSGIINGEIHLNPFNFSLYKLMHNSD